MTYFSIKRFLWLTVFDEKNFDQTPFGEAVFDEKNFDQTPFGEAVFDEKPLD